MNCGKERRMKVVQKAALFLLLMIVCFPVAAFASGETASETKSSSSRSANGVISTDDFEIRVVCGLDGNYRSGASIPVTIYMESRNADFEGTVRMIVPANTDYGTEAAAYEKDVMLGAGVQKSVTMSVYSNSGLNYFKFQLEDAKGNCILDKNITMKGQSGDSALAGVLSDDYTALNYFDGKTISLDSYTGSVRLTELSEDNLPEQASGLEALSYLIINSYDTSKLSEAQYTAIKSWVDQGGVLIIGTGSDYKQTLSLFQDDFVKGTVGDPVEGVFRLVSDQKGEQEISFTKKEGIVHLSLDEGEPLDGILKDSSLIWNRDYGQGHVVVTAFNLGMEPVSSWDQKASMGTLLLENAASGYSSSRIEQLNYGSYTVSGWTMSNALDALYDIEYPNLKLMAVLFLIFVVLVGPGLYLILKLADKRELMWFLVPVLSAAFTAGVFGVSRNLRIEDPRGASITTLYYDMDSQDSSRQVDLAIQVPDARERQVKLNGDLTNLRLTMDDYYSYNIMYSYTQASSEERKYEYKAAVRETAEGYQLNIRNKSTFDSVYMTLNALPDADGQEQCGLEVDLDRKTTGISGTVTNHTGYDLQWVSVYAESRVIMIGELKAGESREIQESDNQYFEYDLYNINIPGYDNNYDREYRVQNNIWDLFCNRYLYAMGQSDVYVYASIDSWDADYIADEGMRENNGAVMVLHKTMGYSDYSGAELLNLYDYAKNSGDVWDSDGQMYAQTAEVEFDIGAYVSEVQALIRAKDSEAPSYANTSNVKVYGFNVKTKQYDELFTDGEVMKFKEHCPYLNEDGTMKLKFECSTVYEDFSPRIMVVGGED